MKNLIKTKSYTFLYHCGLFDSIDDDSSLSCYLGGIEHLHTSW